MHEMFSVTTGPVCCSAVAEATGKQAGRAEPHGSSFSAGCAGLEWEGRRKRLFVAGRGEKEGVLRSRAAVCLGDSGTIEKKRVLSAAEVCSGC